MKDVNVSMYSVPPYAYCHFFDLDDLLTLAKTNRYFINCLLPIASPEIASDKLDISMKWIKSFPKARLTVCLKRDLKIYDFKKLVNITSLNLIDRTIDKEIKTLSYLTRLETLSLTARGYPDLCQNSDLYPLTQLKNLSLFSDNFLLGATLRKFGNLRHVCLDKNMIIKAEDLEYLRETLTSLSLNNNTTVDPLVLTKLKLLSLSIEINKVVKHEILVRCTTLKNLSISNDTNLNGKCFRALSCLEKLTISYYLYDGKKFDFGSINFPTSLSELIILNAYDRTKMNSLSLLTSLKKLSIYATDSCYFHSHIIEDLELAPLVNLTDLTISSDKIKGDCFMYLTQLTDLNIDGKELIYSKFKYLKKLKYLELGLAAKRQDINITELPALVSLEIKCSFVSIISGINTNLQSLAIYSDGLINDNLITKLVGLRELVLYRHGITIRCLLSLPALVFVRLTPIQIFKQKKEKKALVILRKNGVTYQDY
ncbi:MAG: hypothetical protein Harvfovirus7_35 [Harvfovirus sp.]|uniref:Leucine-rich repeat protein n=1 Tax=Harvfovirus sp. TaxID=2487768 RepID=A0A3G5A0W1_9VIRU|nr:MAG: hypothetical protein Harvfovirus7_35 [Harvfovirus sp.]